MDSTVFWIWFSQLDKVSYPTKSLLLQEFGSVEDIFKCPDFSEFSYVTNEENYLLFDHNFIAAGLLRKTSRTCSDGGKRPSLACGHRRHRHRFLHPGHSVGKYPGREELSGAGCLHRGYLRPRHRHRVGDP